jgi:hypothetical protein
MKTRDKILFGVGLAMLIILHWFLFPGSDKEGFFDDPGAYDVLRGRLRNDLASYCKLATFVREQIQEMQKGFGGGSSDISQMYTAVYQCTDQLASVRPSCASPNRTAMRFVPCSIFMDLPDWTDESNAIRTLQQIKDDLPERLVRECEWFKACIKKIKEGLAAGANPPTLPDKSPKGSKPTDGGPTQEQMNKYKEGFRGQCSAEANEYLRRKALEDEAKNCTPGRPITSGSEIARVNSLLDDPSVRNSVSQCNGMMDEMLKLQSDLEKLKNGNLYEWQKDGPKKTYAACEAGGDRVKGFICSLRNMS